jgi:cell division protein FtsL
VLDALLAGRGWIVLIGVLLAGIVFFNVDLLQMNRDIARDAERAAALKRENGRLRLDVARLASSERIQEAAARLGLVLPAPGEVRYLEARPGIDARRAARNLSEPSSLFNVPAPALAVPPAAAAPTTPGATTDAPPATTTPTIDPVTGATVDPVTGAPVDPATGGPIDPATGAPIDPATGAPLGTAPAATTPPATTTTPPATTPGTATAPAPTGQTAPATTGAPAG